MKVPRLYARRAHNARHVAEKASNPRRRIDTLTQSTPTPPRRPTSLAEENRMTRTPRSLGTRIALILLAGVCAGALTGCNQPPALTTLELDSGTLSKKHPKVDPADASNCRKCHREQPAIRKQP
jgi:hypothetical protein